MCSRPRSTTSELSKTPPSRFFRAFSSLSEDVLSRFLLLFSSSTSSRASVARASAFAAAPATRASRALMFLVICAVSSCTSARVLAAFWSSAWYCSRTSRMKVALWAATVWAAVRKCSRTSFTTLPTCCFIDATDVFASYTIFPTSPRSFASCAASALPSCRSATVLSSFANLPLVFISSPATFARPVSSPQSSSVKELCRSSMPVMRTSISAFEWLTFLLSSSRRSSTACSLMSCSSRVWFSSEAMRSRLRCSRCSADSFCSRLKRYDSSFWLMTSAFSSMATSCARRCVSQRPISSSKLAMVLICSWALNWPT
mmetsp:Transcript_8691/g.23251  ORF Transcript_8691/g.23251 Transcript_8691/m.23251 type:complete len:315 (-) Transcript_8691:312-1256(-)